MASDAHEYVTNGLAQGKRPHACVCHDLRRIRRSHQTQAYSRALQSRFGNAVA